MQGGDSVFAKQRNVLFRIIGKQPTTHRILKTWLLWGNYWNEMNLCIMNGFTSPFQICISAICCDLSSRLPLCPAHTEGTPHPGLGPEYSWNCQLRQSHAYSFAVGLLRVLSLRNVYGVCSISRGYVTTGGIIVLLFSGVFHRASGPQVHTLG